MLLLVVRDYNLSFTNISQFVTISATHQVSRDRPEYGMFQLPLIFTGSSDALSEHQSTDAGDNIQEVGKYKGALRYTRKLKNKYHL